MNGDEGGEEHAGFEIGLVVRKRILKQEDDNLDCIEVLLKELRHVGFIVETVLGFTDGFIKLAASLERLGQAAAELQIRKPTYIGIDLPFQWEDVNAFVRQPDGTLFSWCERYRCYLHMLYGIVNRTQSGISIKLDGTELVWNLREPLLQKLESEGIVKHVFPLHDEAKRKKLLRSWVLNKRNFTNQDIDDMYSYFGLKFWKRKNYSLISRWQINCSVTAGQGYKFLGMECTSIKTRLELLKAMGDRNREKAVYQRYEWWGHIVRFRNNSLIMFGIVCLQLPFELAYAHLYEVLKSDVTKFALTSGYIILIQYFTKLGAKFSVRLIKYENNENSQFQADSLVYKVFGLYFMQSYIGVFYHALLHRNFKTLRQLLIQRLIIFQVLENILEHSLPYVKYSIKRYKAVRNKKHRRSASGNKKILFHSKVEKEYLKPAYNASIGDEFEDGLFDDYLQLALQFGMIMMFACAFPLAFVFAAVNSFTEVRTDALKLLAMFRRPIPRVAATIGAWINIYQFLIVMSICTNSVLLVCMYDQERKWQIEPGLAGILIMEHVLLLIKFGFSQFVPEEPAWVRARRVWNAEQVQDACGKQLLKSFPSRERTPEEDKK
ncbi:Anoctamin-like protein At1g73020 [Linum perenne]